MSHPAVLIAPHPALPLRRRLAGLAAVGAARLLLAATRARPARIRRALARLGRNTAPARYATAAAAHAAVTTVSLHCASNHGCLLRSVAIVLLCRAHGQHATWRVGFRSPPPASHAWVEAEAHPVNEHSDPNRIYTPVLTA